MNLARKNNLMIGMNVCEGFYGILNLYNYLMQGLPAPFFLCIGPITKIKGIETRDRYQKFYKHLIETKDFHSSIELLNMDKLKHHLSLADNLVMNIASKLIDDFYSSLYKSKSNIQLQEMLAKNDKRFWEKNFNQSSKKFLKFKRENSIELLISNAEKFLMADKYPELKNKFEIAKRIKKLATKY